MIPVSNADFHSVIRLLDKLSLARGTTVKEREDARKRLILLTDISTKENRNARIHQNKQGSV